VGLLWRSGELYAMHTRASATTSLVLRFDASSAVARFVDSQGGGCPSNPEMGAPCRICRARLQVELLLGVSTADGALAERIPLTIDAFGIEHPFFTVRVPAAEVRGRYFDAISPKGGRAIVGLHLQAAFAKSFPGARSTVPGEWNGFVAAVLGATGSSLERGVMQGHGYFPATTASR